MRSDARPAAAFASVPASVLVGVLLAAGGCRTDVSYVVVEVVADDAAHPFTDVPQLQVDVSNGADHDSLLYPPQKTARLTIAGAPGPTFSVSFATDHDGTLDVAVQALNVGGTAVAHGSAQAPIKKGGTAQVTVRLFAGPPPGDGGAGGDGGDAADRGDAAVVPDAAGTCDPAAATTCGAGMTCKVVCPSGGGPGYGTCAASGSKGAGEACVSNADCLQGSQCFDFGCGKACLRYCHGDGECTSPALCSGMVPCGGVLTGFRTCSIPCDPRGAATSGCPSGLFCFIFAGEHVDCSCKEATRTGGEGAACSVETDCEPGTYCVAMPPAVSKSCHKICKLGAAGDCSAPKACTKLSDPDYKVWGVCL